MRDIVDSLRESQTAAEDDNKPLTALMLRLAADEIERLRAENRELQRKIDRVGYLQG